MPRHFPAQLRTTSFSILSATAVFALMSASMPVWLVTLAVFNSCDVWCIDRRDTNRIAKVNFRSRDVDVAMDPVAIDVQPTSSNQAVNQSGLVTTTTIINITASSPTHLHVPLLRVQLVAAL